MDNVQRENRLKPDSENSSARMRWYLSTLPLWRGVGGDEEMPGAVQHVGEVLGAVAGTVVGDDPVDVAVGW